ncbi:MAG TPA: MFS transporter [Anaerolineales bacterium]|nr:MFS transporter [Anaerolineales bacterium]
MLSRIRATYHDYPLKFWVLVGAAFIDTIGRTTIWPFFALYITQRFDVGMTEAGVLLAIFSTSGFAGNMIGGALTDRIGRKAIVIFGLVVSALSSLTLGLVDHLATFYLLAILVGALSDVAGPAHNAMVADMLPTEKQAEGFGILRVTANLAWIFGPTIGGLLAARSFYLLFVVDAVSSLITAAIVFRLIPETRPQARGVGARESVGQTFRGYGTVVRDGVFVAFIVISALMNLVYLQMYSTLSVYLRDVHGVSTRAYGFLMSMNALAVVIFQFPLTRRLRPYRPMILMAVGTALYMVGFSMYGFVTTFFLFAVAMLTITFGEMVVIPTAQALVARLAPEDKRGRYMAVFGLSWGISATFGPFGAGLILDNFNPNWVWYLGGILAAVAVVGFLALDSRTRSRLAAQSAVEGEAAPALAGSSE